MLDAIISAAEIERITGGYKQPAAQLAELHRQGFYRARRSRLTGAVILERAHYEAICAGADIQAPKPTLQPMPRLRSV